VRKTTMVEIHASDVLACGGFLPERIVSREPGAGKLEISSSKSEMGGGTGAELGAAILDDAAANGMTWGEQRVDALDLVGEQLAAGHDEAPATGSGDDLTTAHEGTDGRNVTNEADFYDRVRIPQIQEIVGVVADFGDVSGLDNLRTKPILAVELGEDEVVGDFTSANLPPESVTAAEAPLTPALTRRDREFCAGSGEKTAGTRSDRTDQSQRLSKRDIKQRRKTMARRELERRKRGTQGDGDRSVEETINRIQPIFPNMTQVLREHLPRSP
jgi:hypothetical protein